MIFAREPYLLHLLAGSDTITALDAAKSLLDDGAHFANEREPTDNLAPLHVAAAWNNLAMCQLLIHYGAEVDAQDIDKRRPIDVAKGECKQFLKRLRKKRGCEKRKFLKVLSYLFQRIRGRNTNHLLVNNKDRDDDWVLLDVELKKTEKRKSCPEEILMQAYRQSPKLIISREEPQLLPMVPHLLSGSGAIVNPNMTTFATKQVPSAPPRRSSSVMRDEFLTSDNSAASAEQLQLINKVKIEDKNKVDSQESTENQQQIITDEKKKQEDEVKQSEEALRTKFAELNIDDLKKRLRRRNCAFGPIDRRNRRIYEAKLIKIEKEADDNIGANEILLQKDIKSISHYSAALQKMILYGENADQIEQQKQIGQREEAQIRKEYVQSPIRGDSNKKNIEVEFFCYLLLDPTRLNADPNNDLPFTFRHFLFAIFYVGKGKRSRPLYHLAQAKKCRDLVNDSNHTGIMRSAKLKRILDIWKSGEGVISLQLFSYVHSAEALVREGAMIDAIGVANLTNLQRGTFAGFASTWTQQQITEFGALLLHKAYVIFQNERCRPFYEADVPARLDWWGH